MIYILGADHKGQVLRRPVRVRVLSSSVITFPVNVLRRCEHTHTVLFIRTEIVVLDASGIDAVPYLFRYVRLVRRTVKQIAAPSVFLKMMVFKGQF